MRKILKPDPVDFVRAHAGDVAARNRVVEANFPLVLHLARHVMRKRATRKTMNELVSDGSLGLLRAAEHFDMSRGNAFSTYASKAILSHMWRHSRSKQRARESCSMIAMEKVAAPEVLPDAGERVRPWLTRLKARDRQVIEARYLRGLLLREVATEMGYSRQRIQQIGRGRWGACGIWQRRKHEYGVL